MAMLLSLIMAAALLVPCTGAADALQREADAPGRPVAHKSLSVTSPSHCIAFSPYVRGYHPFDGPRPGAGLVNVLMQRVRAMGFHCILVYGVTDGFDAVYQAAERYGMQVIAIIWLQGDTTGNRPPSPPASSGPRRSRRPSCA